MNTITAFAARLAETDAITLATMGIILLGFVWMPILEAITWALAAARRHRSAK